MYTKYLHNTADDITVKEKHPFTLLEASQVGCTMYKMVQSVILHISAHVSVPFLWSIIFKSQSSNSYANTMLFEDQIVLGTSTVCM